MISLDKIRSGLAFYRLEEIADRVLTCAEAINASPFSEDFEKRVYDLYEGDPAVLEKLYAHHTAGDMFAPGIHPDAPLAAAALGGNIHRDNARKYGFDRTQTEKQIARMRDYIGFVGGGGNTTALAWSANMVRGILVEAGILQFQLVKKPGEKDVIYIHIPGGKFTEENIKASVEESRPIIKASYGLENPAYYCESWLLSPEVHELLGEDSNIRRFYRLFDVIPGGDCRADILWNVFGVTDPESDLKEKTSLQRSIKKAFAEGKSFRIGIGRLIS